MAGVLTVGYFVLRGAKFPRGNLLKILAIRSFLLVLIGNSTVHWAEQYISSGIAAIIAAIVPLWMVMDTMLLFKTYQIKQRAIIGLVLGFLGIIVIFYEHLAEFADPNYIWGIIVMIIASLSWALGSVYSSMKHIDFNPVYAAGVQMLFAGVASIFISIGIGEDVNVLEIPVEGVLSILYLVVFGSLVAYNAYLYALTKLTHTQVSIYAYINPIVAVLLGWFFLDEKLTWIIGAGMTVTLAGVYFVNTSGTK